MKKLIFLLVSLSLVPVCIASTLFDDWVDDTETFVAGGHPFYVQYIESIQKLNFKMDNIGGMMLAGECETREEIRYCFEDVNYPRIKVKILSLEPDISIERTFSTTTPNIGEQIKVTVMLKNNGDKVATDVRYVDNYPQALKVFSDRNAWEWGGSVGIGEEEKFTYTILAEDITSFDSIAGISYKFGGKEKTKKSSSESINVQNPFSIYAQVSTESADKNEIVTYNLTITNKDESNNLVIDRLEISLDPKLSLVSAPGELKKEGNKLTLTGAIEKKETKDFTIKVKSPSIGKFTIHALASIKLSGRSFKEELSRQFSVGLSDILPILNITSTLKSNSPYNIYAAVKSYGKEEIKDVNIKIKSDLFSSIEETKNIAAGTTYKIIEKTLTAPYLDEEKVYSIRLSGSYTLSSGKTYNFEKSAQLTVTPQPKIVQIIRELNKEEFYPGEEIKVSVKVKSQKEGVIGQVDVSDIFPKEIRSSLLGDVTGYLEELNANEEKKLYSYSLVIPEDYKEDGIEFKTTLNANIDGELIILKNVNKVKVLKWEEPEEIVSLGSEEEQDAAIEEIKTEKEVMNNTEEKKTESAGKSKENTLKRIIGWIKNLFKRR